MPFTPYLYFGGTCRQAFSRYQEIFGGELFLMPMSEMPGEEAGGDLVAHAALMLGDGMLMASDLDPATFESPRSISVSWSTADVTEAKRVFDALLEGGTVEQAFGETFFSPGFGTGVDRFGIPWMILTDQPT